MGIQIYGKSKCFDTKKAERFFKERGVRFQRIDLPRFGMSRGELLSVRGAVGSLASLVDPKHPDAALFSYLAYDRDREQKLLDDPTLFRSPIVRNGKQATIGYQPEVWKTWLASLAS
ncbi:MAG: ArsC family transcriptional regulator, partial [Oscillospiraceae bacterium]|nr:ArsC family transcriptional regulator [Oscillospiraceae bacterium]